MPILAPVEQNLMWRKYDVPRCVSVFHTCGALLWSLQCHLPELHGKCWTVSSKFFLKNRKFLCNYFFGVCCENLSLPILLCVQWTFERDMEGECSNSGNRLLLSIVHFEGSGWNMLKFWFNLFCTSVAEKMGSAAPQLYYGIVMTEIKNNREKCDVTLPW